MNMKRIIVIDDDQSIVLLVTEILKHQYEIQEIDSVDEVVEHCKQNDVDLIITDLFMPNKNGLELIEAIKEANVDIKLIAISGGNLNKNCDFLPVAEIMGARSLKKPFSPEELRELVRSLLN
jgi:two-component system, chemotaxis family, chemotaxis protein CheY